ncbi:hypothetical protein H2O64_09085 [Kordia sp. YSTF-M3]|uniref:Uncharacterized protein n=1 Tax=Kordia aestuariivivens TaxID=2759037 RepID=A0ABR7Q8Q4_9FLAO|nr:hypothetical protein [Kordia aestuariivivens]MBC8754823.1 hypothetical protein [Kordia aestuariivivens]
MYKISSFLGRIFSGLKLNSEKEDHKNFEANFQAQSVNSESLTNIENSLDFLINNDTIIYSVIFGNSDPIILNSKKLDFQKFISDLEEEYIHQEEELIIIKVTIQKIEFSFYRSIYNLDLFVKNLKVLTTSEFLSVFTKAFSENDLIIFNVFELKESFNTSNIFFLSAENKFEKEPLKKRNSDILKLKTVCHYESNDNHSLSPNDFNFENVDLVEPQLFELFQFYSNLLSIIYLFDITSLKDSILTYKINGYKSFKGNLDLTKIKVDGLKYYFPIFEWVYNGGNLNDKIGLSRNIISLHFKDSKILELDDNTFQSIQSSYKVYEKDNIKQYVEIRNKISDQLLDFNNQAMKIVESFASGFQKSSLALISFYISTIVIRVLTKGDFINVFTLDAIILSTAFILGSIIYYCVSRWDMKTQRERFVKSYRNMKERYLDLLDENDIERILNGNIDYEDNLAYIDKKRKVYSRLWFSILIILFTASIILYLLYNTNEITNTVLYQKTCKLLFTIFNNLIN